MVEHLLSKVEEEEERWYEEDYLQRRGIARKVYSHSVFLGKTFSVRRWSLEMRKMDEERARNS